MRTEIDEIIRGRSGEIYAECLDGIVTLWQTAPVHP